MLTPSPKLIFPNVNQARLELPTDRLPGGSCLAHWKRWQEKQCEDAIFQKTSCASEFFSQIPFLCLYFFSTPSFHLFIGRRHWSGSSRRSWWKSCGLTSPTGRCPTKMIVHLLLFSSFHKFEDMNKDPSPLTIIQQERERMGKENKLITAHIIWNLFGLFRGFGGFEGHQSLHVCMLWDHSHTTGQLPLLRAQCHCCISCRCQRSCKVSADPGEVWQWCQGLCTGRLVDYINQDYCACIANLT